MSTQKLDCEQSLTFLLSHSGPIAQRTRFLLAVRASEEKRTTAICLQKSIDVNVIPNLSIVPKKLVMVTLKLTELHSENRPILPSKQKFLSCMAFNVGSRSRRI